MNYILEVAANSLESAIAAQNGNADRIELCENLKSGGITPSYGTIVLARKILNLNLYVLIRPREGDFLYSDYEFEVMKNDILVCKKIGIDGIVSGILNCDGTIDIRRTSELVTLAKPLTFTFNRAIDMTNNIFKALNDVIETGCKRILTSGGCCSAYEGVDIIKKMVNKAQGKIIIIPGAGINEDNILEIAHKTNAKEFHLSGKILKNSKMIFRNQNVSLENCKLEYEYQNYETSSDIVRSVKNILKNEIKPL